VERLGILSVKSRAAGLKERQRETELIFNDASSGRERTQRKKENLSGSCDFVNGDRKEGGEGSSRWVRRA